MKYIVTIMATITKDIEVDAENSDEANELAHEGFSVLNDGIREKYEQDTVAVLRILSASEVTL